MLDDNIDKDDGWFTNEDKTLRYTIYPAGTTRAAIDAGTATVANITGFGLSFMLKRDMGDLDSDVLIVKTSALSQITITGASGLADVLLGDGDTENLGEGTYWHELKRIDPGLETVLSQGQVRLRQAVHRS